LGGQAAFRHRVRTVDDLIRNVREGLVFVSYDNLKDRYEIASDEMVKILNIPGRTLARRKREKRFEADESDRLLRLGRVAALAEETLGSRQKAARWLRAPNRALGGEVPLRLLDTDPGSRRTEDELFRISHGVFS
ncbi:MAG: antitoxin Xre/MbcA/ParS toxin-binding domain-containing protein, partial [Thermoanaerobaculia bacterium]